jgi:hypothetical protein
VSFIVFSFIKAGELSHLSSHSLKIWISQFLTDILGGTTKMKASKITTINVRVDDETKARVAALAKHYDQTISELVREWLKDCIAIEERVINEDKAKFGD